MHKKGNLTEYALWGVDTRRWRKKTREQYTAAVLRAQRWMAENGWDLDYAGAEELQAFMASIETEPARNQVRKALTAWFDYLVDRVDLRDDNPALRLPAMRRRRGLPQAVDQRTGAAVYQAAKEYGPMWQALIVVLLGGGLRATEAQMLQRHMVDVSSPQQLVLRFEGKGGQQRVVPIAEPHAAATLRAWLAQNPSRWVFPSPVLADRPISYGTIRKRVLQIGTAAEAHVRIKPHTLRHTAATRMLDKEPNLRVVQEFLGHASVATTQIYTLVRPDQVANAAAQLDFFGDDAPVPDGEHGVIVGDEEELRLFVDTELRVDPATSLRLVE